MTLSLFMAAAFAYSPLDIPPTIWPDAPPEVLTRVPALPPPSDSTRWPLLSVHAGGKAGDAPLVLALVRADLADALAPNLDTWADDLARDGFSVRVEAWEGGDAGALKADLAALAAEGMVGAVLIGDFPVAWYELSNDYPEYFLDHGVDYGDGVGYGFGPATFPIDLWYMDLDGVWADADSDGLWDAHDGSAPDIWLGRVFQPVDGMDPISPIQGYFQKNHAFRRGEISPTGASLAYVDDDWIPYAEVWQAEIANGYPDVLLIQEAVVTTKQGYLEWLGAELDLMSVFVHSSNHDHFFAQSTPDSVLSLEEIPPSADALFYDLFACSAADYSRSSYLGARYLFDTERGLLAIGSSKTGSVLERTALYEALGDGEPWGAAWLAWWAAVQPYSELDRLSWYYGLTVLGDPTLRIGWPRIAGLPAEISVTGDPALSKTVTYTLTNSGMLSMEWVALGEGFTAVPAEGTLLPGESVPLTLEFPPGEISSSLVIEGQGATNTPVEIPVEVDGWPTPSLCFSPDPVVMALEKPRAESHVFIEVRNCEVGPINWSVVPVESWLNLIEVSGTELQDGETGEIHLKVEGVDLSQTATLRFSGDADADLTVEVVVPDGCGCGGGLAPVTWAWIPLLLWRRRK